MAKLGNIIEDGDVVCSHQWDSGGPGAGSDSLNVYRLNDSYAAISDEGEALGPFDTLTEAIADSDALCITEASSAIECSELEVKEIIGLIKSYCDGDMPTLLINGVTCEFNVKTNCYEPA